MKLRKVKTLYYLLFLAAVVIVVEGYSWPLGIYIAAGMGALLAMGLLLHKHWRCPHCGKPLGRMNVCPVVECPHCKKKVEV